MVRPKKNRIVALNPEILLFKPKGSTNKEPEEVIITVDEWESIRLSDLQGLSYEDAGKQMGISRATFGRIIQSARKTLADALVNGKSIKVEGGNYALAEEG
jgi:uncharacterized protein